METPDGREIAIEVKNYTSQNVSKSVDIELEVRKDLAILAKTAGGLDEIRWVFLNKGPSGPLLELLETVLPNGKSITIITP